MIDIIKKISIEVTKPNVFQAIVAKQYDMNTRFIKATLVDNGTKIDIPATETAKVVINAERKDGQSKGFDGIINSDGTVTVPLHSWMLELDGTVICDISVIDTATDENKKLTTTSFTLIVEKAAYGGDDVTSDPQYDVLVELLENCSKANVVAQEALEKSNEANSKYDNCVEATEKANTAANELESIKEKLAEGGYIHSIEEKNHQLILSFWVGTQAEYNALIEKPKDCYVIITDDATMNNYIVEQGTLEINGVTWLYEKWNNGKAICWCKATTSDTVDPALVYSKELTLPFEFADTSYVVQCTAYQNSGVGANAFQYFRQQTTAFWIGTDLASIEVNVEVIGKWK